MLTTKMLYDNLTNFAGKGIEDPRADHMLPWARSVKSANTPAEIKWSADGKWRRSLGVDMASEINSQGGPLRAAWGLTKDKEGNVVRNSRDGFWIVIPASCTAAPVAVSLSRLSRVRSTPA